MKTIRETEHTKIIVPKGSKEVILPLATADNPNLFAKKSGANATNGKTAE